MILLKSSLIQVLGRIRCFLEVSQTVTPPVWEVWRVTRLRHFMVFTLVKICGFDHSVASPPFVILERPPLQAVDSRQGLSPGDGHIFNPDH